MNQIAIKTTRTNPVERFGYKDVVDGEGALVPPTARRPARPFEVVEEMYGMIQVLAHELALHEETAVEDIIKAAQSKAREGLAMSPTRRYGENNA